MSENIIKDNQKANKNAKVIMIQGTASNAGKSLLCAGLCRIFQQDGYKVAPFKSQNMALNSAITAEGLEMGRAQVMQAQASKTAPNIRMNPILLKPSSDTGSQVIVNGVSRGTMKAVDYFAYKKKLIPDILEAYESLAEEFDIIVVEGAGSPAEINLKQEDIVNMGLAKLINAPVLLCGDIDRGGVFASLYGTVKLLEPQEQDRIAGLLINKFRGDVEILRSGLHMIEELTEKPVLGVIPMLDVDIDDEDSLSSRLNSDKKQSLLDVAVIKFPRLSNFTDFNPLERMDEVGLRYVSHKNQLGTPDLLILPGTKNTLEDLLWLRETGLESVIFHFAKSGGAVIGICGGYQIMGETLFDPNMVESQHKQVNGLGLLPTKTTFFQEKTRTQVTGHFLKGEGIFSSLENIPFHGYEIHMGQTEHDTPPLLSFQTQKEEKSALFDGCALGNVWGCYIHGIFDGAEMTSSVANALLNAKGLEAKAKTEDWETYTEKQYDKLAEGMRSALDMKRIYEILEKSEE